MVQTMIWTIPITKILIEYQEVNIVGSDSSRLSHQSEHSPNSINFDDGSNPEALQSPNDPIESNIEPSTKDAWMIEFDNGRDPITLQNSSPGVSRYIPSCGTWLAACCDGLEVMGKRLGCSSCKTITQIMSCGFRGDRC